MVCLHGAVPTLGRSHYVGELTKLLVEDFSAEIVLAVLNLRLGKVVSDSITGVLTVRLICVAVQVSGVEQFVKVYSD